MESTRGKKCVYRSKTRSLPETEMESTSRKDGSGVNWNLLEKGKQSTRGGNGIYKEEKDLRQEDNESIRGRN